MSETALKKDHILRKLFFSTLYLSTFTFGGGYVIVTLLKKKFVLNSKVYLGVGMFFIHTQVMKSV